MHRLHTDLAGSNAIFGFDALHNIDEIEDGTVATPSSFFMPCSDFVNPTGKLWS
jgi:hypothetical protein